MGKPKQLTEVAGSRANTAAPNRSDTRIGKFLQGPPSNAHEIVLTVKEGSDERVVDKWGAEDASPELAQFLDGAIADFATERGRIVQAKVHYIAKDGEPIRHISVRGKPRKDVTELDVQLLEARAEDFDGTGLSQARQAQLAMENKDKLANAVIGATQQRILALVDREQERSHEVIKQNGDLIRENAALREELAEVKAAVIVLEAELENDGESEESIEMQKEGFALLADIAGKHFDIEDEKLAVAQRALKAANADAEKKQKRRAAKKASKKKKADSAEE